jgi:hypothetical protein
MAASVRATVPRRSQRLATAGRRRQDVSTMQQLQRAKTKVIDMKHRSPHSSVAVVATINSKPLSMES